MLFAIQWAKEIHKKIRIMITLRKLEKIYRTDEVETVALENVNLTVERGEFLSVMGPSGCGKSTLLNIMGLLDLPTSGTVEIDGVDTSNMDDLRLAAFRNQKLGFVFQSFHLINSLNVLDNVELPLLYRDNASVWLLPGQSSAIRRLFWPTSRPVTSIPRWAPR